MAIRVDVDLNLKTEGLVEQIRDIVREVIREELELKQHRRGHIHVNLNNIGAARDAQELLARQSSPIPSR